MQGGYLAVFLQGRRPAVDSTCEVETRQEIATVPVNVEW